MSVSHLPRPKILIAPLDWGLGHATRMIPIIKEFQHQKAEVIIAAEGPAKYLLEQEFPAALMLPLQGYGVQYAKRKWMLSWQMMAQTPGIMGCIQHEHEWLKEIIDRYQISAVISDNRYGLWNKQIPSIFVTHQLSIQAPAWIKPLINRLNYFFINRFTTCWVPDVAGENNLAGELSHSSRLPQTPIEYIGALSRFDLKIFRDSNEHVVMLLSGPEPQRTLLENIFVEEAVSVPDKKIVLVRGLPGNASTLTAPPNVVIHNHLSTGELQQTLANASYVICRSGYSTIMDLASLSKKSILIPTPGQTEQEYLGQHLMKNRFGLCIDQKKFRLKQALSLAENFSYQLPGMKEHLFPAAISNLLSKL